MLHAEPCGDRLAIQQRQSTGRALALHFGGEEISVEVGRGIIEMVGRCSAAAAFPFRSFNAK
jgi:hypothetical protein